MLVYSKMIKLDQKDKLLLHALDSNVRLSYSQLSKITRLKQETVRYRINQLEKEGVIKKSMMFVNSAKLGFSAYQIMLKLQNVNEQKKKKIMDSLIENNFVNWVANIEGNYDIAFILLVKNQGDLQKVIDELYSLFGDTIIKKNISTILSSQFLPRDYLLNKTREKIREPSYSTPKEISVLDEKDKLLCNLVSENGRLSYVDISSKIKISADSVVQRVKKLEKQGILTGSTIVLDNSKIGQLHYKILFYLNDLSEKSVSSLLANIRRNNRVIALMKTLAEWDYEVDIEVENVEQLKDFIMGLTSEFSQIIRDYSSMRIIDMPKYRLYGG